MLENRREMRNNRREKANWWGFILFFWEFGFVGKQKGNEKQQKGKAYNLMQSDQKTRTDGFVEKQKGMKQNSNRKKLKEESSINGWEKSI